MNNMMDEVMELKKQYIELKRIKLQAQRKLGQTNKNHTKKVQQLQNQYKLRKAELLSNKEEREKNGYTNQKDWQNHIELVILKKDNDQITETIEQGEQEQQLLEQTIENLTIDITDAYWTLKITHEYHTNKEEIT